MKASPTAPLEVPQAEFLLEVLIVALDTPAQLGQTYQFAQRCGRRQVAQEVLCRFRFLAGPFDEKPLLRTRFCALAIPVRTTHSDSGKTSAQRRVAAFPPTDCAVLLLGQLQGQSLGADRLVCVVALQQLRASPSSHQTGADSAT